MKINRPTLLHGLLITFALILLPHTPLTGKETGTGEQLYVANCAKCHGREGEGFLQLYPPLHNSRFFKQDIKQLPCIIRYGMKGEIEIDGKHFNGIMPGNTRLSKEQMTVLISHLQKQWGGGTSDLDIPLWLEQCSN